MLPYVSANYTKEVYVSTSARQHRSANVVALARIHRCYVSACYLIAEAHGLAERLLLGGQDRPRSLWHSRFACRARPREHLHTSAHVTSACVRHGRSACRAGPCRSHLIRLHTSAYVSIRQRSFVLAPDLPHSIRPNAHPRVRPASSRHPGS